MQTGGGDKVSMPFHTDVQIAKVAQFVAELTRQGVRYLAYADDSSIIITLTGGY